MRISPRQQALLRAAFVGALLAVFVLALLPVPFETKLVTWQDKVEHFVLFGALYLLGCSGWPRSGAALALTLLAYGVAMELAQALTAYRSGDPADWLADACGVGAAALFMRLRARRRS